MSETQIAQILSARLKGHIAGAASIYNAVPQEAAYPYIVLNLPALKADNGLPAPFHQQIYRAELTIWSAYQGDQELVSIGTKVKDAFHNWGIDVPGIDGRCQITQAGTPQKTKGPLRAHTWQVTVHCTHLNREARS